VNQPLDQELVWNVRLFIYNTITNTERPPTIAETAAHFGISAAHAQRLFLELHQRHAIFLDPQTDTLRMANPYSTVPTRYRVLANGRAYWANCAWDAFGIPAMLDSDAQIHTSCANTDQPIVITIQRGQFEPKTGVVHFPLPVVRWYEDLVFT